MLSNKFSKFSYGILKFFQTSKYVKILIMTGKEVMVFYCCFVLSGLLGGFVGGSAMAI